MTGFAIGPAERDVGDFNFARAPAAFFGLESVLGPCGSSRRTFAGLGPAEVPAAPGVSWGVADLFRGRGDSYRFRLRELISSMSSTSIT